ncbi:MAG: GTP-binding protein [Candidatus Hodgkinia cicadicola]
MVPKTNIVTVVGHIDHGKTCLLDELSFGFSNEVGGITQRIRVCMVKHRGYKFNLIDTPGHSAFANTRAIMLSTSDVALLLIEIAGGVKTQTRECIKTIVREHIATIVVYTKMDEGIKDVNEPRRVLVSSGLLLESSGGTIPEVHVSSKSRENLKLLMSLLSKVLEVGKPQCDLACSPSAIVLDACFCYESCETRVIVLVTSGVLMVNQTMLAEGKLVNVHLVSELFVLPSAVTSISGINSHLKPGTILKTNQSLENVTQYPPKLTLAKVIIKADSLTSIQGLRSVLISRGVVPINATLGIVTLATISEACAFGAIVVAFNTSVTSEAMSKTVTEGIRLVQARLIYDVETAFDQLSKPYQLAKVIKLFQTKTAPAYGALSTSEGLHINQFVTIRRNNMVVSHVKVNSLRRFGEDVITVPSDQSFGFTIKTNLKLFKGDELWSLPS